MIQLERRRNGGEYEEIGLGSTLEAVAEAVEALSENGIYRVREC